MPKDAANYVCYLRDSTLGDTLRLHGRFDEALVHLNEAVEIQRAADLTAQLQALTNAAGFTFEGRQFIQCDLTIAIE